MNIIQLDTLPLNHSGKVQNINCKSHIKHRLLDLGLVKGTNIVPVFKSPSGDPTAFFIRGSTIAIRKEDAKAIDVII